MVRYLYAIAVMALILFTALVSSAEDTAIINNIRPEIAPDQINIGTFYSGTEVRVTAEVGECNGAVIVLESGDEEVRLNRKGRVAGIWLNVAKVTVADAPHVYIMATSDDLDNICSAEAQRDLRLGKEFLRNRIKFTSSKPLTGSEFDQFFKLKLHDGTYSLDNRLEISSGSSGGSELSAVLPVSSTVPPGTYAVAVYCFRDGELTGRGVAGLSIERTGLSRVMSDLAHEKAALYGIVAILAAMAVGLGIGMVFNSMPRRRR